MNKWVGQWTYGMGWLVLRRLRIELDLGSVGQMGQLCISQGMG